MYVGAVSDGPIRVVRTDGTDMEIPISKITFDTLTNQPSASGDSDVNVASWLAYLASIGALRPATAPPPIVAFELTAAAGGSTGNGIRIDIAYLDAVPKSYAVTATKTDVYDGLTQENVKARLSACPGLVSVLSCAPTGIPAVLKATHVGNDGRITLLDGHGAEVLTLKTNGSSDDDLAVSVAVEVATDSSTYTIKATWKKMVEVLDPSAPSSALAGLEYVVKMKLPDPPAAPQLPQAGSFFLGGGADIATAKATAFAQPKSQ